MTKPAQKVAVRGQFVLKEKGAAAFMCFTKITSPSAKVRIDLEGISSNLAQASAETQRLTVWFVLNNAVGGFDKLVHGSPSVQQNGHQQLSGSAHV